MKFLQPDDGTPGGGTATLEPPATATSAGTPGEVLPPAPAEPASLIPPSTPPEPAPDKPWINPDGSFVQGWYQRFPEDMQAHLARYKNAEELAKGHGEQHKFIGRKGVFIPNDKSTPEEVSDFRKAAGVPETPDGYQIKPETIPDGLTWNDDLPKPFLAVAHKHHVSQAAMKDFGKAFMQMEQFRVQHGAQQVQEHYANELKEGTAALQEMWKADFDKNRLKAQQAAALVGVDPLRPGFRDPQVVAAFVRLGNMISEDKIVGVTGGLNPSISSEAMAKDIINNPNNPMHKPYHDGDPDAQATVRSYFKQGSKK